LEVIGGGIIIIQIYIFTMLSKNFKMVIGMHDHS
jgi:hypothetical protein